MAGVTQEGAQGRGRLRDLLARHDLHPRKALGQHFLADPNTTRRIVALADLDPSDLVVEIGVGTATLTAELAATGARVLAYEVDRRLEPVIDEALHSAVGVDVRFEDAAAVDLASELAGGPWTMVANLPYNVGTAILLDALRHVPQIRRFVVMVQLEVARRLVASPGSKDYGVPSVVCSLHGTARLAFRVPASVFVPAPNVESAVVRIDRGDGHPLAESAITLAAAGFGQRRKMLRRSLQGLMPDPVRILENAGISPTARPEQLDAASWLQLAEVLDG